MKHIKHPPPDQLIVDNYFKLQKTKGYKQVSWLYGMLATYGISLEDLNLFTWNSDLSITVHSKKQKIKPLHPQWIILFQLKEKQPSNLESCFHCIEAKLIEAIKTSKVSLNLTDLQLAYRLRKNFYRQQRAGLQKQYPSSAALSLR